MQETDIRNKHEGKPNQDTTHAGKKHQEQHIRTTNGKHTSGKKLQDNNQENTLEKTHQETNAGQNAGNNIRNTHHETQQQKQSKQENEIEGTKQIMKNMQEHKSGKTNQEQH